MDRRTRRIARTPLTRTVALATVAGVLAVPACAAAGPSVFATTAKLVPAGQTPTAAWTQADLASEGQYFVTNAGNSYSLRESNGQTAHGILTFDVLPSAYRALQPKSDWLAEGDTGAQPHATCDVASLTDQATVLGWQGSEPAYGYVPFQATSAGLGDDPATWLPAVNTATGLTLTPDTDLSAACVGLGGTFHAADTVVAPAASFATALTAPLQQQVKDLQAAKAAADAAKAKADAEVKRLTLEATTFKVAVSSAATLARGLDVDVTGPPNRNVFVRVTLTEAQRKKLKVPFRTLGLGNGVTDAKGKVRVVAEPRADTAPVLLQQTVAVPVTVSAFSGDRAATLLVDLGG